MAYNPFHSFRKYQRFWMASILLLCMVTFVLCTGAQGDLSNLLLGIFSPRHGKAYAKLDGRQIYGDEMEVLKRQRNVANEFMQRAARLVLERADKVMKSELGKMAPGKEGQAQQQKLGLLQAVQRELQVRVARPRYFEGNVKLEDLLDFAVWRTMADRLDIQFVPDTVHKMINLEIFALIPEGGRGGVLPLFDGGDMRTIQYELRRNHQNVTDQFIYQALRDEFRVRAAQLCLLTAQPGAYTSQLREKLGLKFKSREALGLPEEVRIPLSPAQIWDIFKQKRSQFDVAIVPIKVEQFLDKVPEPSDKELQVFFDDFKKTPYDPASPTPGFMIPAAVKAEWVMADPTSAFYQGHAKAVSILETVPPIGWSPAYPELVAAVRYGVGQRAFAASMAVNYQKLREDRTRRHAYAAAPLTEPSLPRLLSHLSKPTPQSVASLITASVTPDVLALGGGININALITGPAAYWAHQYRLHEKELAPLVAEEDKARLDFAAELVSFSATPWPLARVGVIGHALRQAVAVQPASLLADAEVIERFLPLGAVEKELKKQRETVLARGWVSANMATVKEELERRQGKEAAIRIAVKKSIQKYGLQHAEMKDFRNQFDISQAPELAPLRESFEKYRIEINTAEGRAGKQERLKEEDFPRLFFDASEPSFSVAVGRYIPKAWPPVVEIRSDNPAIPPRTVSFFDIAEKPFVFWKTEDRDSRIPATLAEVRDKVVRAWKLKRAREKFALARAKQLAVELQKSGGAERYGAVLRDEARSLKVTPIYLNGVAELVPGFEQTGRTYHPFTVSKEQFEFPRDDMAKQILALTYLDKADKALKTGYSDLDALNSELLKGKNVQQIQVLTNRPQNTFYVAVVTHAAGASMGEFAEVFRRSLGDRFLEIAHEEAAGEFRRALMAQLRQQLGDAKIEADPETIKSFDANVN
jgi:hypothetical protein